MKELPPLAHDFSRTLRSKSVLISMAVIIALSLLLIPLVQVASNSTVFGSGGNEVLDYYSGTEWHFLGYSYNVYGQPIQGTSFNVTVTSPLAATSSAATTNSSGFASWAMPGPAPTSTVSLTTRVNGNVEMAGPPSSVGSLIAFVTDPANASRLQVVFFGEGPDGSAPRNDRVYYSYSAIGSGGYVGAANESQMTYLGPTSGYVTVLRLPPIPAADNMVTAAVFDSNGTMVTSAGEAGTIISPQILSPKALFTSIASSILALVVPLMAILVAYNSYGKDRATGVLDSVLARPVTRRGLGLIRYLALVLPISLAIVIAIGVMALISQLVLGSTVPLSFALSSIGGLMVEGAAFVGIMMLLSRLIKSTGGLMGVGIVLWVVLDFLWSVIVVLAAVVLGTQLGSGDYLALSIRSGFFNPAQFYGLVGEYLNGISLVSGSGASIPISPATYGLNPITLGLAAAFWVIAPLAGFLYLATRRD
ncbi:MAG: ABC transporter permease [Nitrososphaerota archaeon]|nr:ABC transporter permease [Nitrososphaerota archaeon]